MAHGVRCHGDEVAWRHSSLLTFYTIRDFWFHIGSVNVSFKIVAGGAVAFGACCHGYELLPSTPTTVIGENPLLYTPGGGGGDTADIAHRSNNILTLIFQQSQLQTQNYTDKENS